MIAVAEEWGRSYSGSTHSRVASPLGLILLKLEATSPQDAADILALLANAPALGQPYLKQEVATFVPQLTLDARTFWTKVSSL